MRLSVSGAAERKRQRGSLRLRHSTSITATVSPESRPRKSASIPDVKKHIGVSVVPGAASAQSRESKASAGPRAETVTAPQPAAWKKAESTSLSWAASRSSGRATPACSGSHVWKARYTPSPAANPASWRMLIAWSGAWRSRPSRSCRSAPRPMVIPSAAALRVAVIWDANLGLRLHAAQEFGLVDDRDPKCLRLLELRAGGGAGHHRGGLLGHAVRDVAACSLDQLGRPGARQRRERPGDHVGLSREQASPLGRDRLRHVEAELLQPLDQLAVLGLGKEPGHRGGDGFADAANLIDLVGRSLGERLHGPEVAGQQPGPLRPDVPDPEREDQGRQRLLLGCLDRGDELLRRLLRKPFERKQLHRRDLVEVSDVLDELGIEQRLHTLGAEPPDVHGPARCEVDDALEHPTRAGDVGTVHHHFVRWALDLRPADGATAGRPI